MHPHGRVSDVAEVLMVSAAFTYVTCGAGTTGPAAGRAG